MGFFINGRAVDDANSNYSGALKNIRYLTEEDDLKKISDRIQALENKIGGVIKGLYIKLFSCFFDNGKVAA